MKTRIAACLLLIFARSVVAADRFDVNDVSFLWPIPETKEDVAALLSADAKPPGSEQSIWPKSIFNGVIEQAKKVSIVGSSGAKNSINFSALGNKVSDLTTWKVVAFRVDPSAPGTAPMFTGAFGVVPQIRLILQPVTDSGGKPKIHDFTAHLVYNFVLGFEPPPAAGLPLKGIPDRERFAAIVEGLKALKKASEDAGVTTEGKLSVHPALKAKVGGFSDQVKSFLLTQLKDKDPFAVAFMGIDSSEPWIFFAVTTQKDRTVEPQRQFTLGNEFAQMITFKGGESVLPRPRTTNFDPSRGFGVSTSSLFKNLGDDPKAKLDKPVFENAEKPLHRDIPDIIANPKLSHFFNTDCASCHSESSRRVALEIGPAADEFRYHLPDGISGVDENMLPDDRWNVRNFGWGLGANGMTPTVTVRTANESADSAEEINKSYLQK